MEEKCKLHEKQISELEKDMKHIRDSLHKLVGKPNDIIVKVINGKTEERLASELIGEMYLAIKDLKKESPKQLFSNLSLASSKLIPILFVSLIILSIVLLMVGQRELANDIQSLKIK